MKYSNIFLNKYFLAASFFVVWMLFFDQKDFFTTLDRKNELKKLQEKKAYYTTEIAKAKQELSDLQGNTMAIERFGRERYLLKKEGEDLFIIEDTNTINK